MWFDELRGMNILYFNANYRNFLGWWFRKLATYLSESEKKWEESEWKRRKKCGRERRKNGQDSVRN